jgi:hypothetical protein
MVRQGMSQKVTFVNSTSVNNQSRCGEYTVSLQGGVWHSTMTSHLYAGLTPNAELQVCLVCIMAVFWLLAMTTEIQV